MELIPNVYTKNAPRFPMHMNTLDDMQKDKEVTISPSNHSEVTTPMTPAIDNPNRD